MSEFAVHPTLVEYLQHKHPFSVSVKGYRVQGALDVRGKLPFPNKVRKAMDTMASMDRGDIFERSIIVAVWKDPCVFCRRSPKRRHCADP